MVKRIPLLLLFFMTFQTALAVEPTIINDNQTKEASISSPSDSDSESVPVVSEKNEETTASDESKKVELKSEAPPVTLPAKETEKEPFLGIGVYASPISFALLNKTRNIYAGYNIRTLQAGKHSLNHDVMYTDSYQKNIFYGIETSMTYLTGNLTYECKKCFGNWSYFNALDYRSQKFNESYIIKHQIGVGPIGVRYTFIEDGKYIKNFDIGYIPIYESVESDYEISIPYSKPTKKLVDIRNSFSTRFQLQAETWFINYALYYRPAYYIKTQIIDMQDINLESNFTIGKSITNILSINYTNILTRDIRLMRANNIRPDNTIHNFSININFNI